ncbi:NAD(P)H-hydrate dehydratase [Aquiflexum sp.]|uniref:NAD(P)H-hydrate dehydratase n=1 Tax=Aquiflexum sp. TaxID=1872584 RepID=UPI00359306EE
MLSIISGKRVSELDKSFIQAKGISSLDLMENAALSFCDWYYGQFPYIDQSMYFFCGPGNNGGDGLAIARLLSNSVEKITLVYFKEVEDCSKDYQSNFYRLPKKVEKIHIDDFDFAIGNSAIIVDCIFGVGINRPVEGKYKEAIEKLIGIDADKISVDIPSGIPADTVLEGEAFNADFTITFQFPKLSLLFPEHAEYTGKIEILDIGISNDFLKKFAEQRFFVEEEDIPSLHKQFHNFSHKGDYGKVLLLGGSTGKVGAILLASKAALRTGSGLVSSLIPNEERIILQIAIPVVMVYTFEDFESFNDFDAIGIGPGWGGNVDISFFENLLCSYSKPMVIDADGLNALARNPKLMNSIPKNSILTPHLKEFERLVGACKNHRERIDKAKDFSVQYGIYLVLKGAFTCISCPDGNQYFNSTGNKYIATAGSGDVLTGMITSILGQGYSSLNAAICGVYHHGLAGELASKKLRRGLIASDIIKKIPETYRLMGIE